MRSKWIGGVLSVWIAYSPVTWADKLADLKQRAEQGDAVAQTDLGTKYALGSEVAKDYRQAQKWFQTSAEQGNVLAQYNLGLMYAHGEGMPTDLKE
ncbi:MAG: tetratricopeptide repeat protein, partial [Methylobacter sp.]|nr:tetratricopeptide repeat protein [Methylobacter sp.]